MNTPRSTAEQLADWLKQLRLAVITNATEERQQLHQQWGRSLAERVTTGVALTDISISEQEQHGVPRPAGLSAPHTQRISLPVCMQNASRDYDFSRCMRVLKEPLISSRVAKRSASSVSKS